MRALSSISVVLFALTASLFLSACASDSSRIPKSPQSWSQATPGMTREQLHQLLGQPATRPDQFTEIWRGNDNWKLIVTFDENGNVRSVVDSHRNQ
jgi:outer membrane protein assembly factor BamE (lipoprotein component of BamABCDE complex)